MAYTDAERKAIQDSLRQADKSKGIRVGDPVCLCCAITLGFHMFETVEIETLQGKWVLCRHESDGRVRRWQVPRHRLRYSEYTIKSTGIVIREWHVDCPPPKELY